MEENKFTITLSDGTVLDDIGLNGNNYISKKAIKEKVFKDNLDHVEIKNKETEEITVMADAVLNQLTKQGSEYWFVLIEKSTEEKEREELAAEIEAQAQAIEELASIIGNM